MDNARAEGSEVSAEVEQKLKYTPWFWGHECPVRPGWYEYAGFGRRSPERLYWTGVKWVDRRDNIDYVWNKSSLDQWRGLQKGSAALLEIRGILKGGKK